MKLRGFAKGNYRMDGARKWGSLTDAVVDEMMGGKNAATHQAKSYQDVIKNIKEGKGTRKSTLSGAEKARKRMIERNENKHKGKEKHPDIAKDKAQKRAYPHRK